MMPPLAGNSAAKSAAESFISAGRIPHAILIEGDCGTGRHTLSHFIAKAAVCENDSKPCSACQGCHLADVGSHPDISLVLPEEGKKNITVDIIRALRAEAFVKPHMASRRVFIIDGACRMNEQAQNALLKVLEEPPAGVIFILICTSRTALLETIVSRCAPLSLSVPEYGEALDFLKSHTDYEEARICAALKEAECNIGRAKAILDGAERGPAAAAAEQFIKLLFSGSELDMLRALQPFEKDRIAADEFFSQLKLETAAELRRCYNQKSRARTLTALYSNISRYKELLNTNINLPLLFSAAVCESRQLKN